MRKKFAPLFFFLFPTLLLGQVYLTKDQALKLYFSNANVERKTVFLTDKQVETIQTQAKSKVESRIVTYYIGRRTKGVEGYAFFETHIVRTLPETFMVVLEPDGSIRAVELLAFYEPEDYLPPKRWLALFQKKNAQSNLWLKRGVQNIVGATLSAQGMTEGVRKVLATFETAIPKEK